jgi:preprotein translocase subunit SecA
LGTVSIEKSERLAAAFTKRGIPHEVLNAKAHAREADIIAQAGRVGAVTVATNMAGRGVDIKLGGNPEGSAIIDLKRMGIGLEDPSYDEKLEELTAKHESELAPLKEKVKDAGGLYVVGTERHESRRIDNQLRGRSGRQGDPGETRFFLSLEDDLMRRFRGEQVASIMERLNIPDDQPIEAGMVNKAVERAQRQVESQNFEIRKNVLKYDEVMTRQREVIYRWRSGILHGELTDQLVNEWTEKVLEDTVLGVLGTSVAPSDWDWEELSKELAIIHDDFDIGPHRFDGPVSLDGVVEVVLDDAREIYAGREKELGPEVLRQVERSVMLQLIDNKWREHLADMDYLRAGIGLRAMGQRDPLSEYQREGFEMFSEVVESVKRDAVRYLFRVQLAKPQTEPKRGQTLPNQARGPQKPVTTGDKVGRNELCPCGSGKKYKRCHGATT